MLKEVFPNISDFVLKDAFQGNLLDVEETVAELLENNPGKHV